MKTCARTRSQHCIKNNRVLMKATRILMEIKEGTFKLMISVNIMSGNFK